MRCAVLGDPVGHSLSPALHRAAYAACGLDWQYDAIQVPAGGLARFADGLDASWRGLSVTAPLKHEAAAYAASRSHVVELAAVANTLVHAADGSWAADNTDVPGAVAAVRERWSGPIAAASVLGGGATAISTGLALAELGAAHVRLLVRDRARGAAAAAVLRRHPSAPTVEVADLAHGEVSGDLVVSTIPAAAQSDDLVARCGDVRVVFEVVYHPWPTPLAASVGPDRVLVTGLDLLVHQAALQFALYTGVPAASALPPMRTALLPPGGAESRIGGVPAH